MKVFSQTALGTFWVQTLYLKLFGVSFHFSLMTFPFIEYLTIKKWSCLVEAPVCVWVQASNRSDIIVSVNLLVIGNMTIPCCKLHDNLDKQPSDRIGGSLTLHPLLTLRIIVESQHSWRNQLALIIRFHLHSQVDLEVFVNEIITKQTTKRFISHLFKVWTYSFYWLLVLLIHNQNRYKWSWRIY